jgi:hypothetical protein
MARSLLFALVLAVCFLGAHADVCHKAKYDGTLDRKSANIHENPHDIRHITIHVHEDCSSSFVIGDGAHHSAYKGKIAKIWDIEYGPTTMNGQRVFAKITHDFDDDRFFSLELSLFGQEPDIVFAMNSLIA